ncbi:MAG: GntR family transcriptional regulator [Steroidobacteraceae bacterium]
MDQARRAERDRAASGSRRRRREDPPEARAGRGRRRLGADGDRTVVPLYHQVYVVLRERIRSGAFDPARPMPGEHQLASEFGVSRVTLRRTLQSLESDGLVERRRGVGTFAVPDAAEFRDRYDLGGQVGADGRDEAPAEVRNLGAATVEPPPQVAQMFGSQESVLRLQRLRHLRGEPFTVLTIFLPGWVADSVGRRALERLPAPTALEQAGLHLARTEQSISAVAADEPAAAALRLPLGAPLIFMSSLFADDADRPLMLLEGRYRPDMYEYRTTMLRSGRGAAARWRQVR